MGRSGQHSAKTEGWRERLANYKGGSFPPPLVPITGVAVAVAIVGGVYSWLPTTFTTSAGSSAVERVILALKFLPFVAVIFFLEFVFGAAARSTSTKASAEPAGIQAAGQSPFAVVQVRVVHGIRSLVVPAPPHVQPFDCGTGEPRAPESSRKRRHVRAHIARAGCVCRRISALRCTHHPSFGHQLVLGAHCVPYRLHVLFPILSHPRDHDCDPAHDDWYRVHALPPRIRAC